MTVPIPLADLYDFPSPEHARWGLGTTLMDIPQRNMQLIMGQYANGINRPSPIQTLTHPLYDLCVRDWEKWWLVYEAGEKFIYEYLKRFSNRENPVDFNKRRELTPIPAFASSAIDEIKNSIFQRIGDTVRTGGSDTYQKSVNGELGGVNRRGGTMTWFIGHSVLPRLLVQKKIGVYVDAPNFGVTQAQKGNKHPYFCVYRAEDFRSWTYSTTDDESEFQAIMIREFVYELDPNTNLPIREVSRFRHVFLNPATGRVNIQFYDNGGLMIGGVIQLEITKIPFVVFEITESLMKNVANHQIALMNLESSDISYGLKSNFPFYTEMFDPTNNDPNIRRAQSVYQEYFNGLSPPGAATVQGVTGMPPGSPIVTPAAQGSSGMTTQTGAIVPPNAGENADIGATQGRRYPKGFDRPAFIAPPSAPLEVSMAKQSRLKDDVRSLVHLALASVQSKSVSAESKLVDRQQGLESGLAAIGLELEHGERQLAVFWSMYEGTQPATVNYPRHWSIKSVEEIKKEIEGYIELRENVPSITFKREINKMIAETAIGTRVSPEVLAKIKQEIDNAKGGSSDAKSIASDVNVGILGPETASTLRGYPDGEVQAAMQHRVQRLALIAQAQSTGKAMQTVAGKEAQGEDSSLPSNPAARGIPDASPDPALAASLEKQDKPGRGEAQ